MSNSFTQSSAFETLPATTGRGTLGRLAATYAPVSLELDQDDNLYIWRGLRDRSAPVDYDTAMHIYELQHIDGALAAMVGQPDAHELDRAIIHHTWMRTEALDHLWRHPDTAPTRPASRQAPVSAAWAREHLPTVIVRIEGARIVLGTVRGARLDYARVHLPDGRAYDYAWDTIAHCVNACAPLAI